MVDEIIVIDIDCDQEVMIDVDIYISDILQVKIIKEAPDEPYQPVRTTQFQLRILGTIPPSSCHRLIKIINRVQ